MMTRLLRAAALSAALMLVTATVAATPALASGDQHRPFDGTTTQGYGMVVDDAGCPLALRSAFTQTGHATHLGRTVIENTHCTIEGGAVGTTEMTFIAANGDKVFATYTATAPPVGPEPLTFTVDTKFTIVGGTGRFTGATGGGHMLTTIQWPGFEPNYWPTTSVWTGTIAY